jgi:hypothetical protein
MSIYPNKNELIASLYRYSLMAHGFRPIATIDIARLKRDWRSFSLIVEMLNDLPELTESVNVQKVDRVVTWILDAIRVLNLGS